MEQLTPGQFVVGLGIGIAAAMLVFAHADKRGNKRATAWGIASFFVPAVALVYFGRRWWEGRGR